MPSGASRILKPFDIVSAPYVSLDGSVKTFPDGTLQRGLFMVLAVDYDNITCVKVTSQRNEEYLGHSFLLQKAAHPFLKTDSYVQLDKLHTIFVSSANFVGSVEKSFRYEIFLILKSFLTVLADSLRRFCPPPSDGYVSPNSRR